MDGSATLTPNKSKVLLLPAHIPGTSTLSSSFPLCPEVRLLRLFMPKPSVLVSPGLLQYSEWHLMFWRGMFLYLLSCSGSLLLIREDADLATPLPGHFGHLLFS